MMQLCTAHRQLKRNTTIALRSIYPSHTYKSKHWPQPFFELSLFCIRIQSTHVAAHINSRLGLGLGFTQSHEAQVQAAVLQP